MRKLKGVKKFRRIGLRPKHNKKSVVMRKKLKKDKLLDEYFQLQQRRSYELG